MNKKQLAYIEAKKQRDAEILKQYNDGVKVCDIKKDFGFSAASSIYEVIGGHKNRHGFNSAATQRKLKKIKQLRGEGKTFKEIAAHLGVSDSAVHNMYRRYRDHPSGVMQGV